MTSPKGNRHWATTRALAGVLVFGCQASVSADRTTSASTANELTTSEATAPAAGAPQPAPNATTPTPEQTPEAGQSASSTTAVKLSPTPASEVRMYRDQLNLPGNLVFERGTEELESEATNRAILRQVKQFLENNLQVTSLRIEGHTDSLGAPETNERLSGERALAVKEKLVELGVAPQRLIAVGFGSSKPIADNSTVAGRAQNRRTEFHIAGLHGRPYLNQDPTGGGTVFETGQNSP